jgi:hypothetical protein
MDDGDRYVALALELSQVCEQFGDVGGVVLVAPMKSDERIEDNELRRQSAHGVGESAAIFVEVET